MWGFLGVAGTSGTLNVLGEVLGVIWMLGLGVATIAWLTLPSNQGRRVTSRDELLRRHGGD